ncbi:MAG: hypothetical protein JRJ62_00160 [Deltaproteobacteria bacterium]|nr:hypothetical protein [Deltaproteobacteria bacterium]
MSKYNNDSNILSLQQVVMTARIAEAAATADFLNGLVSESVVLDYMMETECAEDAAIASGVSFKDL